MKVLVLGGKGFIGSHLLSSLTYNGFVSRSYDRTNSQDILNVPLLNRNIEWCDIVYHCAALTDVQESLKNPNRYYETNVVGTIHVVNACRKYSKKCIYTSTAAIYQPHSSPYANSKYIAELLIQQIPKHVIFRLFNVYGDGMHKSTMMSRFIHENPLTIYGNGKQTRDFIFIDDVVDILIASMAWDGFIGDVGSGRGTTVSRIAKKFGKPIRYEPVRQEITHSVADITPLRRKYKEPFSSLDSYIDKYRKV